MLRLIALTLALASPAVAQTVYEPFEPNGETTHVTGAWARYQEHILKLSGNRYAVLFRPGYVDEPTAIRAVTPLCAAQGLTAQGIGTIAPADVVLDNGGSRVLQGYRVACR